MKKRLLFTGVMIAVIILASTAGRTLAQGLGSRMLAAALGTGFTFQGRLSDGGAPANGSYDFTFLLYDDPTAGIQIGPNVALEDVPVSQGLFTVSLDFGDVYDGTALYLEVQVRPGNSTGAYTPLTPRQALSATPYALFAAKAGDAGTLNGLPGSYFQAQVSGSCAVGSAIRVINVDGTVECQTQPPVFSRTPLDMYRDVGASADIAIGSDGLPLISYYDGSDGFQGRLKVAHCKDINCTSAELYTLDIGNVGKLTSIAIGADNLGIISFVDYTWSRIKVAHCDNINCSSAAITTLDSSGANGIGTSIAIGVDGLPLIAYIHIDTLDLRVAHCSDIACTSATFTTYGGLGITGSNLSMAIGTDGYGLISYYESATGDLLVAHCQNIACTSATHTSIDTAGDVGDYSSIAIGSDGFGIISYYAASGVLKVAHCTNISCSSANIYTLTAVSGNNLSSIAIGTDGLPIIVFSSFDPTNGYLTAAHCNTLNCSNISLYRIEDRQVSRPTVVIGIDGLPLISYKEVNMQDLIAVHCDDLLCAP